VNKKEQVFIAECTINVKNFSHAVKMYLSHHFPGSWIGCDGPKHWPPRYPDLNPLDFCLWGHMKDLTYQQKVET
jgi:hypothetical protein